MLSTGIIYMYSSSILTALIWTDKFGAHLFSEAEMLLILDYLVDRNLLFAQPSSGTDDTAMKLASFEVIKSLCKPCKCVNHWPFKCVWVLVGIDLIHMYCSEHAS